MARRHSLVAVIAIVASLVGSCGQRQLPGNGELLVVVDTDVEVPGLASKLQVDLYDTHMNWFFSREILRNDPGTWPVSFAVTHPNDPKNALDSKEKRTVYLRLRLYPDGKTRDYRGELFYPLPMSSDDPATCPSGHPEGHFDDKTLDQVSASGQPLAPVHPLFEPLPDLTIDRLVRLDLSPGAQGTTRIVLRGQCFGQKANLFDLTSCIDTEGRYEPIVDAVVTPAALPIPNSEVGSFPRASRCEGPTSGDGFAEQVCIDGGGFLLGDQAVFGFGDFDGFPERVAVLPPMIVDRFEVTVGRFRAAMAAGLLPNADLPTANDGKLATSSTDADPNSRCTFTSVEGEREEYPLNCVSFDTARAFCRAIGGDLPTEAEWEWVAAAAGRPFQDSHAWGSTDATCDTAIFARSDSPAEGASDCVYLGYGPQPVASSLPNDVTPVYGVVGLGGNVREWTRDSYRSYCSNCWREASLFDPSCDDAEPTARTVRGSDWTDSSDRLLAGLRDRGFAPATRSSLVGFRCFWVQNGIVESNR